MKRLKAILTFTAALAFAAASYSARNFRGYDPAAFPVPVIDPPFQPAPWAFAIWGLIFLLLIAHAAYGLFRRAEDPLWDAPRWPLFASMALGASWLEVAMRAPVLATVQIWIMTALAIAAAARAPDGREAPLRAATLSFYAGWLTAATAVATGTVLVGYGGLSLAAATFVVPLAAVGTALVVLARGLVCPPYAFSVIWALIGIMAANLHDPELLVLGGVGALALAATAVWRLRRMGVLR